MHDCPNVLQIYYIQLYNYYINKCELFSFTISYGLYSFIHFFYYSVYWLFYFCWEQHGFSWKPEWSLDHHHIQIWGEQKLFKHKLLLHLHIYSNLHVTYKNGNSEANTFHVFTCRERHETHETKLTTIIQVWSYF